MKTSYLFKAVEEFDNETYTYNGDKAFKTTLNKCLDLFYSGASYRDESDSVKFCNLVTEAFLENPLAAIRVLFYLRDIRGNSGQGERDVFRSGMEIIAKLKPEIFINSEIISLIPYYGRWDDIFVLFDIDKKIDEVIFNLINKTLSEDITYWRNGESVSLLAKWLPSINTSSQKSRLLAKKICRALGLSEKIYRQTLSKLRSHINILEKKLSNNQFDFDYSGLPSRAKMIHSGVGNVFMRKDEKRYMEHVEALAACIKSGSTEVKTNTQGLYPHEIIKKTLDGRTDNTTQSLLDSTWRSLPNYFSEESKNRNWLAVVDTSGSMTMGSGQALNVSFAMGLYIAERNNGIFKNQMITFSSHPTFIQVDDEWSIEEKANYLYRNQINDNTNLRAVFELVLGAAKKHNLPASEMPEAIVIISDMQFDSYSMGGDVGESTFESIKKKYKSHGYEMPKLIFWNASEYNTGNVPVTVNEQGVILAGGCKPGMFEMILGSKSPDEFMFSIINSERYSIISF